MGESFPLRRRPKSTIDVVSPFPDTRTRPRNRWWERLRGLFGLGLVVVVSGFVLALLFAITLLALAIFVATVFN